MRFNLCLFLACSLCLAGRADAAAVVTSIKDVAPDGGAVHDPYVPGAGFTPSNSDLIAGLLPTHDANDTEEQSAGAAVWTDGSVATVYGEGGSGGDAIDHAGYGTVQSTSTLTYDLGGLYDLSKVDIYTGWNDSGRDDITFELLASADDATYTSIASYNKGQDDTGTYTTPVSNLHSITDDAGGSIAAGVQYVRLVMSDADNGFAGIAEIDVFQVVPEPTTVLMAAVALASMAASRRRD